MTRPNAIGADAAKRLTSEFRVVPQGPPSAAAAPAVEVAMRHAKAEAESVAPPRRAAEKANAGAATGKGKTRGNDSPSAATAAYSGGDLVPLSASVGGPVGSDAVTATIANSTPVVPPSTAVSGSDVGVGSALDATSLAASKKSAKK